MDNPIIILHSKDRDTELLKELREALIAKGFRDDCNWNDRYAPIAVCIAIYTHVDGETFDMYSFIPSPIKDDITIPVSRNDFQTMFLLY